VTDAALTWLAVAALVVGVGVVVVFLIWPRG
jgi:hypothetical protein